MRKLVKDGFVIRKPTVIHSRSRARASAAAKAKGRHTGHGALLRLSWTLCPVFASDWWLLLAYRVLGVSGGTAEAGASLKLLGHASHHRCWARVAPRCKRQRCHWRVLAGQRV